MAPNPKNSDDLRNLENGNSGYIGGGPDSRHEQIGGGQFGPQGPQGYQPEQLMAQQAAGKEVEEEGGDHAKDELEDRAKEELKKRAKESLKKPGEKAAEEGAEGAAKGAGEATTGAGGEAATGGLGAAPTAEAGAAAGGAGTGAGGAAGAGAGAAGTGAGAAGGAGVAAGEAGAAGAAAGGAGAAGAGAAGGAAATGAAAAGGTAAGAATGTAAGASAAAGVATSETGVGLVVGLALAAVFIVGGFIVKYRKEVGMLLALVIVGLLIGMTLLLNALKPFAETLQTAQKFLSPMSVIVQNRQISILGRFATAGSAAAVAENQQHLAQTNTGGGHVLAAASDGAADGKLKTLFDAMKQDGFEQHIKDNYGLEFKQASGGVDIQVHGSSIGVAHNAVEAQNILQNNFPDLQNLLDDEMNGWSWAQHVKVARPSKTYYSIPALSIPGADSAYSPSQLTDVIKYQVSTILAPGLTNMAQGIACFTTGQMCNSANTPAAAQADAAFQDDPASSLTNATQTAYDDNLKGITPDNNYGSAMLSTAAQAQTQKQLQQNAAGILGWLDIAASLHKMAEDPNAQELPVMLRQKQAGALWTWNESAINQMLASDATSQASSLITRNYDNFGDSQAYYYVAYGDVATGQGMTEQQKVNSIMLNTVTGPLKYISNQIAANPVVKTIVSIVFNLWLTFRSTFPAASLIIKIAESMPLSQFLGMVALKVLDATGIKNVIEQSLGISSEMMLPVCDPSDQSYNFGNCLATGAHAQANQAIQDQFGGAKITAADDSELQSADVIRQQASLAALPWTERLFSRTNPNSFVNVAAMQSPISKSATQNVASFVQAVFGAVWSSPSRVAFLAARPAFAASGDSSVIDGQDHYGIPLSTIKSTNTVPNQLTTANGTCPQLPKDQIDTCKSYSATIDALIARYTYNPSYAGN